MSEMNEKTNLDDTIGIDALEKAPLMTRGGSVVTLVVDAAWEGTEAGTDVTFGGETYQFGTTAFESIQTAYNAVPENGSIRILGTGTYHEHVYTSQKSTKVALLDIGSATLEYDEYNLGGTGHESIPPFDVTTVNIGTNGKLAIVTGYGQSASTYCTCNFTSDDATAVLQYSSYGNAVSGDNSGFKGKVVIDASVPFTYQTAASQFANVECNGSLYYDCDATMAETSVVSGTGRLTVNRDRTVTLNGDFTNFTGSFGGGYSNGDGIMIFGKDAQFKDGTIKITGSQPGWPNGNATGRFEIDSAFDGTIDATGGKIFLNGNTTAKLGGESNGQRVYVFGSYGTSDATDLSATLNAANVTATSGSVEHAIADFHVAGDGQTVGDGADADTNAITLTTDDVDFAAGGSYNGIWGTSKGAVVNGDIDMTMTSGNGNNFVGSIASTVNGKTRLTVSGGSVSMLVGAYNQITTGNIELDVTGGTVACVYGVQLNIGLDHDSAVGSISDIAINVTGGTVTGGIRGGNRSAANDITWQNVNKAASVTISIGGDAQVNGTIYGTSSLWVDGDINISISGNASVTGDIYAGSKYAATAGTTNVTVSGGTVSGKIYAGGAGSNSSSAGAGITVTGGTVTGDIYASGKSGDIISENSVVTVTNAHVADVYAQGGGTVTGKTSFIADGDAYSGSITAFDSVTITANNSLTLGVGKRISYYDAWSNAGTLTVDMAGETAGAVKLVDNLGSTAMTLAGYGNVTLDNNTTGYLLTVNGNDLYATKPIVAYDADGVLIGGYDTISAAASAVTANGSIKILDSGAYETSYGVVADGVTLDVGSATVTFGGNAVSLDNYKEVIVGKDGVLNLNMLTASCPNCITSVDGTATININAGDSVVHLGYNKEASCAGYTGKIATCADEMM